MDLKRLQELAGNRPTPPKIRWYDYVIAIIAADIMVTLLFAGFGASSLLASSLYGLSAGLIYNIWSNEYCKFRAKQENKT